MKKIFLLLLLFVSLTAGAYKGSSVAGLFPLQGSGRVIYNFNQGWRFHLGDAQGAAAAGFGPISTPAVGRWCAPLTA